MKKKEIELGNFAAERENVLEELVSLACSFKSDIYLVDDEHTINAKSILGITAFTAQVGNRVIVEVEGPDQDMAIGAMIKYLGKK